MITFDDYLRGKVVAPNPNYTKPSKRNPAGSPRFIPTDNKKFFENGADLYAPLIPKEQVNLTPMQEALPEDAYKYGIEANTVNSIDELYDMYATNKHKSLVDSQSVGTQLLRMTGRIGNEIIMGSLAGFGNIIDGVINTFRDEEDGWYENPYTQAMTEIKEGIDKKLEIYRENPDESFDLDDTGWWADNFVSVATTLSLMLPAMGYGKILGKVGQIGGKGKSINSLLGWGTNRLARGFAKVTSIGKTTKIGEEFNAVRELTNRTNKISNYLGQVGKAGGHAVLSRMGEDMMEGHQVYNDVYENSLDKLNSMDDKEYNKFLYLNPEMKGKSKEEQADAIATDAARTTFDNDFAMILMDVPQFMALGRYFGKGASRALTGADLLAAENVTRQLAGKELIKNNIKNRLIASGKHLLKNPLNTWGGLELGEGIEEMYQGIWQDKGMEVAAKYFNPSVTFRGLESYLQDGSIWEQGFWGAIGGVVFKNTGRALNYAKDKAEEIKVKHTSTAEEYEEYKRVKDEQKKSIFETLYQDMQTFGNNLDLIAQRRNPYSFEIDPSTGVEIYRNGNIENSAISDDQVNLLTQRALDEFIAKRTMDAVGQGIYDLYSSIIRDPQFTKFVNDKIGQDNGNTKLNQQIADRMDDIASTFATELSNAEAIPEANNPLIMNMMARKITTDKMRANYNKQILSNIDARIAETDTNGISHTMYQDKLIYDNIHGAITAINNQINQTNLDFENNQISKSAHDRRVQELNDRKRTLLQTAADVTVQGGIEQLREELKDYNISTDDLFNTFNDFYTRYGQSVLDANVQIPRGNLNNLMEQKALTITRDAYTRANIPVTESEYSQMYDDFSLQYSKLVEGRINETVDAVKKYLVDAENYNEALAKVMNQETGVPVIDNNMNLLKYGYTSLDQAGARKIGQLTTDIALRQAIEDAKREHDRDSEIIADAEQNGTTALREESTTEQQSPSTGEQSQDETSDTEGTVESTLIGADPANPASYGVPESTTEEATELPPPGDATISMAGEDRGNLSDSAAVDGVEDESPDLTQPVDEYESIDEQRRSSAHILAGKYVIESLLYNKTLVDNLASDANAFNKFKDDLRIYLQSEKFTAAEANSVMDNAIRQAIQLIQNQTGKSEFAKIALNMSVAFGEDEANEDENNRHATTETVARDRLYKYTDKFLQAYIDKAMIVSTSEGQYAINIEGLMKELIYNPEISDDTAIRIYNNLVKYISSNDQTKYIFTGLEKFAEGYNAEQFIQYIKENKVQMGKMLKEMHLFPVEAEYRTDDYDDALHYAITTGNVFAQKAPDADGRITNISIFTEYNNHNVKLGTVRAVDFNDSNTVITPRTHRTGFRNQITIDGDNISLDCDFLFDALIKQSDKDAKDLFNTLYDYNMYVISARRKYHGQELQNILRANMTERMADYILNNSYIQRLLNEEIFISPHTDKIKKATYIADTISKILFYEDKTSAGVFGQESNQFNVQYSDFEPSNKEMKDYYADWKQQLLITYNATKDLQEALNGSDKVAIGSINAPIFTNANIIQDKADYVNIADAGIDIGRHDFVIVDNKHTWKAENGKQYGAAPTAVGEYSMGFVVGKSGNTDIVAKLVNALPLRESNPELYNRTKKELSDIIWGQLRNVNPENHEETFNLLTTKLKDLLGYGLFRYAKGTDLDIKVTTSKNGDNIYIKKLVVDEKGNAVLDDKNQLKYDTLVTFYSKDNNSNNYNNNIHININGTSKLLNTISDTNTIKSIIDNVVDIITENIKINRSFNAFKGSQANSYYYRKDGKFYVNLGGQTDTYNNYAEFMVNSRGFDTNMDGSQQPFTTKKYNERRLTISMNVGTRSNATREQVKNSTNVTELFNSKDKSKNQYSTEDVLRAANVKQDQIDLLLGTKTGVRFVTPWMYHADRYVKKTGNKYRNDARAFYNNDIYITDTGIQEMNNSPMTAIRLILHENLHRSFKSYSDRQKQRIINELREVFNYTNTKLQEAIDAGHKDSQIYQDLINMLKKATDKNTEEKNMEEFLVESLTQHELVKFLNNTKYKEAVNFADSVEEKKSIFQKLIDIILKLFGYNKDTLNKNSILAREYMILSRTNKSTKAGLFNGQQTAQPTRTTRNPIPGAVTRGRQKKTTSSPVEGQVDELAAQRKQTLDDTVELVNQIKNNFATHVAYSDNFVNDHIYYIDGKQNDTSVTQVTHPSDNFDTIKYGASAGLGNMFDDASRHFFEHDGHWAKDFVIPNTVHEDDRGQVAQIENSDLQMKQTVEKIKDKLDEIYGVDRYKAIAVEFPIAGLVELDGEMKTMAGTTDLIIATDDGFIDIYDFKTKRGGKLDADTKAGYERQVNAYRQVIEANNPGAAGKVRARGLFVATTDYQDGNEENRKYSYEDGINRQILVNGVPIQDINEDYAIPYFQNDFFVPIENKDIVQRIEALPDVEEETIETQEDDSDIASDNIDFGSYDDDYSFAVTETVESNEEYSNNLIEYNNTIEYTIEEQNILNNAPRNEKGQLLAPNEQVSNLTEKQYAQVRTKAFKEWFGDWEFVNPFKPNVIVDNGTFNADNVDMDGYRPEFSVRDGDRWIGSFHFEELVRNKDKETIKGDKYLTFPEIGWALEVDEKYRGQGYGKALYYEAAKIANRYNRELRSAKDDGKSLSNDAKRVWESLVKRGMARKEGNRYIFNKSIFNNVSKKDLKQQRKNKIEESYDLPFAVTTTVERHVESFVQDATNNMYGIQVADDMSKYLASVPSQFRSNVEHLLAAGYLSYTCQ